MTKHTQLTRYHAKTRDAHMRGVRDRLSTAMANKIDESTNLPITLTELGRRVGLTRQAIANTFADETKARNKVFGPPIFDALAIAQALDTDPAELWFTLECREE